MKPASRKPVTAGEQKRNQRQYDRERAPAMRSAFPQVAQVRIELTFSDRTHLAPSSQSHALFPAARAFFRFACPCQDCDGEFDVTANVGKLAAAGGQITRTATSRLSCQGVRSRDRATGALCPIELGCRIVMTYTKTSP